MFFFNLCHVYKPLLVLYAINVIDIIIFKKKVTRI